jgi:hypothetical protein
MCAEKASKINDLRRLIIHHLQAEMLYFLNVSNVYILQITYNYHWHLSPSNSGEISKIEASHPQPREMPTAVKAVRFNYISNEHIY